MQEQKTPLTLIDELRNRTRHLHAEAEMAMAIHAPQMSIDDYVAKIVKLYSLYRTLHLSLGHEIGEKIASGIERLSRDLRFFKKDISTHDSCFPDPDLSQRVSDPYFRMGMMYVIEGSALGGQSSYRGKVWSDA